MKKPNILFHQKINTINDISTKEQLLYSKMKYGEYDSLEYFANKLFNLLKNKLNKETHYFISSSPYGHVETAATQINIILSKLLKDDGYNITKLKITRHGGFNVDNYANMSEEDRKKTMNDRHLSITKDINLSNSNIIILDDIKITGKHQIKIEDELKNINYSSLTFLYIFFNVNNELPGNNESLLNETYTKNDIYKILEFFNHNKYRINSRTVKLFLHKDKVTLNDTILNKFPIDQLKRMYLLSKGSDKYFLGDNYKNNFKILNNYMCKMDLKTNKIIKYNAKIDDNGNCIVDGETINELLDRYSRFKFGDIKEIKFFSKELANKVINSIETDKYTKLFFKSIGEDEILYLIAPGIRNVVSSSNMLMKYFSMYINPYLSKNKYPTFIVKTLTRIKSGSSNYAELTEEQRIHNKKENERTIVPTDEFIQKKAHIFFIDDVEVTGATYKRIKKICLDANVLSFTSLFIFKIVNNEGKKEGKLEHYINTYTINGTINDNALINIINSIDFFPVQRLLRVVLSTKDKEGLLDFYKNKIINKESLLKIYYYAMSNDYLWIKDLEYREGLLLLETYLIDTNLI